MDSLSRLGETVSDHGFISQLVLNTQRHLLPELQSTIATPKFLLTVAALLGICWTTIDYVKVLRLKGNLKGPPIYPLVLNNYLFWGKKSILEVVESLFEEYGETTYIFTRALKNIITISPDNIQHIHSPQHSSDIYKRVPPAVKLTKQLRKMFGQGIFISDGDIWAIQRYHANPLFKRTSVTQMSPIFLKKGEIVLDILNKSNPYVPVDVQELFMRYTLDSFGEIGFGVSLDLLESQQAFPKWFDEAQRLITEMSLNPLKHLFYLRYFNGVVDKLDSVVYDIIQEKFKENDLHNNIDLLSQFLSLKDSDGNPYPKQWIRDIVMNFMIAGRDTTATLLTWTFYLLATNPRVLEKAHQCVDTLEGEQPTPERLERLDYIDWVIKESLRVRAPVPGVTRGPVRDDVLPDGTLVKEGTRVRYYTYFLHRYSKYWDNPKIFIPERWEHQSSIMKHSYQYLPFHVGPTSCIGRKMAELEAKTLLVKILQHFTFTPLSGHPYTPFLGMITNCENGCPLFFQPRNK